jgi:hypothetical protein
MTWDSTLDSLLEDTVTIEPFSTLTGAQEASYSAAVTYRCLIERGARRVIGNDGREVVSNVQVTIPNRVHVDPRSRITLPAGFVPQTPAILGVSHLKGLGMDHTVISV